MKGKTIFHKTEADQIIELIRQKVSSNSLEQKAIRNRIRKLGFYASDFSLRDGYTVNDFTRSIRIEGKVKDEPVLIDTISPLTKTSASKFKLRDEHYILDLCDEVLKRTSIRQHLFDFLRGDTGRRLPVDAYYPNLKLVVEYREKQHTESVAFFDKQLIASGMSRALQRKMYDELRRTELPKYEITLIELNYCDFKHNLQKRLVRDRNSDLLVIQKKLEYFLC